MVMSVEQGAPYILDDSAAQRVVIFVCLHLHCGLLDGALEQFVQKLQYVLLQYAAQLFLDDRRQLALDDILQEARLSTLAGNSSRRGCYLVGRHSGGEDAAVLHLYFHIVHVGVALEVGDCRQIVASARQNTATMSYNACAPISPLLAHPRMVIDTLYKSK